MADNADTTGTAALGARLGIFQPKMANVYAGFVLAVLAGGGGLTILGLIGREVYRAGGNLPWNTERGMSWFAAGLGSGLGLGLSIGGVLLGRYAWRLRSHQVEACEYGFRYWQDESAEEVAWEDIAAVREIIRHERPPILKGPAKFLLPKFTSSRYIVLTRAGKTYDFDGNSIGDIARMGTLLSDGCRAAGSPWETVEEHA